MAKVGLREWLAVLRVIASGRPARCVDRERPLAISEAGLHLVFETVEAAKSFASLHCRGDCQPYDSNRRVYTNRLSALEQRVAHAKMNTSAWTRWEIECTSTIFARVLGISQRSCRISLGKNYPLMELPARRTVRSADHAWRLSYAV